MDEIKYVTVYNDLEEFSIPVQKLPLFKEDGNKKKNLIMLKRVKSLLKKI